MLVRRGHTGATNCCMGNPGAPCAACSCSAHASSLVISRGKRHRAVVQVHEIQTCSPLEYYSACSVAASAAVPSAVAAPRHQGRAGACPATLHAAHPKPPPPRARAAGTDAAGLEAAVRLLLHLCLLSLRQTPHALPWQLALSLPPAAILPEQPPAPARCCRLPAGSCSAHTSVASHRRDTATLGSARHQHAATVRVPMRQESQRQHKARCAPV